MEQLKTSVSTRRVRGASVAPDISVNQFSIKEACGDQLTTRKTKRASIHNGVVVRLKRQLRRQSVFLSRIYHKKKLSVNVKDIINV
jgi:ribosomal protein L14